MSEFHCSIVQIGKVGKHPNADTLDITHVFGGYPVIFRRGEFKEGDLAVFIPEDAIIPKSISYFDFLGDSRRIRAKRLRGLYSEGVLAPIAVLPVTENGYNLGEDVTALLGIERYETPEPINTNGSNETNKLNIPDYTDIEPLRKFHSTLEVGQTYYLFEKIHGANGRFMHDGERLWVGSHHCIKKPPNSEINEFGYPAISETVWWRVARTYDLENRLKNHTNMVFFGEVYGANVQDMKYGLKETKLVIFDIYDKNTRRYLDVGEMLALCMERGLQTAPFLGQITWEGWEKSGPVLLEKSNGFSYQAALNGDQKQICEGLIIRPIKETYNPEIGRVILKLVGENYKLRKK